MKKAEKKKLPYKKRKLLRTKKLPIYHRDRAKQAVITVFTYNNMFVNFCAKLYKDPYLYATLY